MTTGLQIGDLVKSYGQHRVLDRVSLTVARGEVLGLLGPNGAGKTTLVSIVAGLCRPDSGSVRVAGFDALAERNAVRGLLGLAGQDIAIYPTHTVEENLRFFGGLGGLRRRDLHTAVTEVLDALDLTPLRRRPARELSGGQQRRLHAGCALVHRPEFILLDEPTAGADPQTRQRLLELVRALARDGATVIYTTHYLPEIEELRARVVVLSEGRICGEGSVDELIARHTRSELVLRFDGDAPALPWPDARSVGDTAYLPTASPAHDLVKAVEVAGQDRGRLRGVELARADLERAYLNLLAPEQVG